jgi:hypothetical protein
LTILSYPQRYDREKYAEFSRHILPMILETRDSGIREKEIASLYRMAKMRKKAVVAV